jgi:hypothetical protein
MTKEYENIEDKLLKELARRLSNVQSIDNLTKEDADILLVTAIAVNYKLLESNLIFRKIGIRIPRNIIKKFLKKKIDEILKKI